MSQRVPGRPASLSAKREEASRREDSASLGDAETSIAETFAVEFELSLLGRGWAGERDVSEPARCPRLMGDESRFAKIAERVEQGPKAVQRHVLR